MRTFASRQVNRSARVQPLPQQQKIESASSQPYDPCLGLLTRTWLMPDFRRQAIRHLYVYWIQPVKEFLVSYDYLLKHGYMDTVFKPFSKIFPILHEMLKAEDELDMLYENESLQRRLLPIIAEEGQAYITTFSDPEKAEILRNTATDSILSRAGILTVADRKAVWVNLKDAVLCKVDYVNPFLRSSENYIELLEETATRYLEILAYMTTKPKTIEEKEEVKN